MVLQQELPVLLGEGMRLLRVLRSSLVQVTALIPRRRLVVTHCVFDISRISTLPFFHLVGLWIRLTTESIWRV